MRNYQKGSVVIWIIIVVVIIVGVGFYFYSQNKNLSISSRAIQNDSDWQTYANNKLGFSLQYPTLWTVQDKPADSSGTVSGVVFYSGEGMPLMSINRPIREFGYETLTVVKTEKVTLNGINFTKTTFHNEAGDISVHLTWGEDNWNKSGEIWSNFKGQDADSIFSRVLSTLKITN